MNEKQDCTNDTAATSSSNNISLIIDYGNGEKKSFNIPWVSKMDILDVLNAVNSDQTPLRFEYSKLLTDRGGHDVIIIDSIDDVAIESEDQAWLLWINQKSIGQKIRLLRPRIFNRWKGIGMGDVLTFKFSN